MHTSAKSNIREKEGRWSSVEAIIIIIIIIIIVIRYVDWWLETAKSNAFSSSLLRRLHGRSTRFLDEILIERKIYRIPYDNTKEKRRNGRIVLDIVVGKRRAA